MENKQCCGMDAEGIYAMHKSKKWVVMAGTIMMLSFALSAFIIASSYSESTQPASFRSFGVDGEGKVTAIPDVARFTFGLTTEGGKDISKLQKENTDKMNKAIEFIKSQGIVDKDIKTENYNLEPKYQYYDCGRLYAADGTIKPCPPAEIIGYSIKQTVSVKVRDFSKVGDVLSGAIKNGANTVSQLYFELDDPSSVMETARELAIKKAIDKANKVAKAGGFKIGRLLSIEEGSQGYPIYRNYAASEMKTMLSASGSGAPQIEAGSQEVKIDVTLRYEIK